MTKTIKIKKTEVQRIKRDLSLFLWSIKEEKEDNNFVILNLEREDNIENINEIEELEKEYNKKQILPLFIPVSIAFLSSVFFTLFLIFGIINTSIMGTTLPLILFLIPGSLCILLAGVLLFIMNKQINNYIENDYNRYIMFKEKIHGIISNEKI